MDLSVIIVSYNEAEYIMEAIDSCLSQNFNGEFEIIIGDDGSTDNTIDIILSYEKRFPNITHFVMDRDENELIIPSKRVSNIIKRGMSIAKGKYFVCLSGDDYFCDSKFQKQYDFLENKNNKKYAAIFSDYKRTFEDKTEMIIHLSNRPYKSIFVSGIYVHISCFMFRKEVYLNNLLLDRYCDDVGLIFSILRLGKIKYDKECSFAYRQRTNSIMHNADILELDILEISLMQELYNAKCFRFSSLSRFYLPLKNIYKNRNNLDQERYRKYIIDNSKYDNDFISYFRNWDNLKSRIKCILLIFLSTFSKDCFKIIKKIDRFFFRLR